MKTSYKIFALASLVTLASCSEGTMDYINKDTHNPAVGVVPAKYSITDAIMSSAFSTVSGSYAWYASTFTEQEFGTGNNQFKNAELRIKSEVAAATTYNNEWNSTYANIANLRQVIEKTSEGGLNEDQIDILGMAQTLFALNFGVLTDLHGDIPCSQAGYGTLYLTPVIDTQESVYNDAILGMLDKAIANLENAKSQLMNNAKDQDILFAGNPAKWLGFAYALKARYLLHTMVVNPSVLSEVLTAANNAVSAGFDGVELTVFNGVDCDNPWSAFWWSRSYTGSSATVVKLFEARKDNRLSVYNYDRFGNNEYGIPGNAEQAGLTEALNIPVWLEDGAAPIHLFSKSELYFILAEVKARQGGDAASDFKTAIEASFDDCEATNAVPAATKFENNGSDYAAGLTVSLKEIMVQKYLSQCRDEQIEAYNDIRRCKALGENFITLENSKNTQNGENYWPERFPYGNSSVISNPIVKKAFEDTNIYADKIWIYGGTK